MIKPALVWRKVRKGMELNLGELSVATDRGRNELSALNLPLQKGKISLQDYRRIMRKRQDEAERQFKPRVVEKDAPSGPASNGQTREAVDMFYGRSLKRGGRGASRQARQSQLQGSG